MSSEDRPEDVREDVLRLIETTGVRVAVQAAIDVAGDKAAPAPARATAAGLLLRAAALGGFGRDADRDRVKEPHEMTAYELAAQTAKILKQLRRSEAEATDKPGLFD